MNVDKATALAREIFSDEPSREKGMKWWLFEHGTLVLAHMRSCTQVEALGEMRWLADALGPYEGQGSTYGDFNPMPLKRHPNTWLVVYPFTSAIVSLVDADDFGKFEMPKNEVVQDTAVGPVKRTPQEAMQAMTAGLTARTNRNRDARERKIVACSEDKTIAPAEDA